MDTNKQKTHSLPTPIGQVGVKRRRQQEIERPRKSARLEKIQQRRLGISESGGLDALSSYERARRQEKSTQPVVNSSYRKRCRVPSDQAQQYCKRRRATVGEEISAPPDAGTSKNEDPIAYWSQHRRWPAHFPENREQMQNLLARKRSVSSRSRKSSDTDPASATPNSSTQGEQKSREQKSAEYRKPSYKTLLETKGVFMEKSSAGISDSSKTLCQELFLQKQASPQLTLFDDDVFEETCKMVQDRNEAKIIQDITRLIVPSAQVLAVRGEKVLKGLIESVNEGWNNSIPITKTRPQPDYAVGFRRQAFTQDQLDRMQPIVGDFNDQSYFMATWYMYFPFLTCEVKCGATALDIADRQNAHSAAIAVRAVVELFRVVKREKELHRQILAFSVSHDHCSARIYGYYAEFDGTETKYYCHTIHKFDFTALDGREKWTAYKFTKNVYDNWMPKHFKRICSAIDQFPAGISFSVSSELSSAGRSGLSQDFGAHSIVQSRFGSESEEAQDETQSSTTSASAATPSTSVTDGAVFKKPRKETRRERK